MHVTHLSLTDFRSYRGAELALEPGATALVGPNGQGKTNLVEALSYLATLSSHRVATDAPLVRQGAERAVVRTSVVRDGRATLIEVEITAGKANRARINKGPVPRAREVRGLLRTVLFAPEDLSLVKGEPGERRRFLDDLLSARSPRFFAVRADYERVLRQRTALLKSAGSQIRRGHGDVRTLDVWDAHLATTGAELLAGRLHLVRDLREPVATAYAQVSEGPRAAATSYRSALGDDLEEQALAAGTGARDLLRGLLLDAMSRMRSQELDRGVCLVGPHRDELVLGLGELPAKGYASHGESWSYALALRLASFELLRQEGGGDPVLVLDDVFAELDTGRRERLAAVVAGAEQVLVTAAVEQDVPRSLSGSRVDVREGQLTRVP